MTRFIKRPLLLSASLFLILFQSCFFNTPDDDFEDDNNAETTVTSTRLIDFISTLGDVDYEENGSVTITKDDVYYSWPQYGKALMSDTHGEVIKISYIHYIKDQAQGVNSSFKIYDINPDEDSYLVFDYKCSFYSFEENKKPYSSENCVSLYVDDEKQSKEYGAMGNSIWRTSGVKLSADTDHSVEWRLPMLKYYSNIMQNAIYLDNIRLVPASEYEKVNLSPKGKQETFIDKPIKFTANAEWSNSTPEYSVSEGAAISADGIFTASKAGTYTVTAKIDGKTASNKTVIVYDAEYFNSTVNTAGKTFKGKIKDTSSDPYIDSYPDKVTLKDPSPKFITFDADGFFVISGTVTDTTKKYCIFVQKTVDDINYNTCYYISGDFTERIWLRFGDGEYKVYLATAEGNMVYWNNILYVVNCTSNMTMEQAMFTMPSSIVNSDCFEVSNAVHDALADYPEANDGAKLQLFHDWIMHHFHYDYVSLVTSKRKSQYSDYCIREGMAVCEGYANTFAAMARYVNIPCSVIGTSAEDMNHAWNEVYYNNEWKLVDVTWDDTWYDPDQSVSNTDKHPYEESYNYFLIDLTGKNNDHVDKYYQGAMQRKLKDGYITPPYNRDMPDGWY